MDQITGWYDVCMWKPANCVDAMDKLISASVDECVNVETEAKLKIKTCCKCGNSDAQLNWSD